MAKFNKIVKAMKPSNFQWATSVAAIGVLFIVLTAVLVAWKPVKATEKFTLASAKSRQTVTEKFTDCAASSCTIPL
jgi:hypothetical protein